MNSPRAATTGDRRPWRSTRRLVRDRLDTLTKSKVISQSASLVVIECVELLERRHSARPDEEAIGMFATHLAMALQRVTDSVRLDRIEIPAEDLARMSVGLELADVVIARCRVAGYRLPDFEREVLALHLTAIVLASDARS